MKNKKREYKFKKWWWRWFKPEGWDSDWLILKIAQMDEAKNSVFIEQQKKRILEKYFVKRWKMKNKEKTYKAYIVCRNCDYGKPSSYSSTFGGKEIDVPKGKKVKNLECPNCGCKELYNSPPER